MYPHWSIFLSILWISFQYGSATDTWFINGRLFYTGMRPPPPPEARTTPNFTVEEAYIVQPLDHFDNSDKNKWKQRYMVNEAFYKPNGPIFIWVGGEAPIVRTDVTYGQMFENGKKFGALMFSLEHRFYGDSKPTEDVSVDSLRYLTSQQAMEDLDKFIKQVKTLYSIEDAKVVVFGGSYPGALVVWYRSLYPQSTVAGVSSSAPLLSMVDFSEYMEVIGEAMNYYEPGCYDAVETAFNQLQALVNARNIRKINSLLVFCDYGDLDFNDPIQLASFYDDLSVAWRVSAQYNGVGSNSDIARYCRIMTNEMLGDPLTRYAEWHKETGGCIKPDYKRMLEQFKEDQWDAKYVAGGTRQWLWQQCNEFGHYHTTNSKRQPFGVGTVNLNYHMKLFCEGPFGITLEQVTSNVANSNAKYGGLNSNATRVFLTNGAIDPWYRASVYNRDLNPTSPSRFVEGTSHCYDTKETFDTDPPGLTKVRDEVTHMLESWLK